MGKFHRTNHLRARKRTDVNKRIPNGLKKKTDQNEGPWKYLPSLPLQIIYSFLSFKDKSNMSLVCKNWLKQFSAPCNWKRLKFDFLDESYRNKKYPVLKFAERYGNMTRFVEISFTFNHYYRVQYHSAKQFELFIDAIAKKSTLFSISLKYVGNIYTLPTYMEKILMECIIHLMRSQHQLRSLEFVTSELRLPEATEIFNALFLDHSCPLKTLKYTNLWDDNLLRLPDRENSEDEEDFNEIRNPATSISNLRWVIQCLRHLEYWEVDFAELMQDIIANFPQLVKQTPECQGDGKSLLKKLVIRWSDGYIRYIPPESWKAFIEFCPRVEMDLVITIISKSENKIQKLLNNQLPLHRLYINVYNRNVLFSIKNLLEQMSDCNLTKHLQHFCLIYTPWNNTVVNHADELEIFIRNCPKLETISLTVAYPFLSLEDLLKSLVLDPPQNIRLICITVLNIPEGETQFHTGESKINYSWFFRSLGIHFSLHLFKENGTMLNSY